MLRFKILLTLLLFAVSLKAQCTVGCRKCNSDYTCAFCDRTQGFILQADKCIQVKIANCIEIGEDGKCNLCASDYYPSSNNEICSPVTKKVDNCEFYSGDSTCSICNNGYTILNAKCVTVSLPIKNCADYGSDGSCEVCSTGYVPTSDGLSCAVDPLMANCAAYTNLSCKRCRADYVMNSNYYFNLYYDLDNSVADGFFMDQLNSNSEVRRNTDLPGPCQPVNLQNCSIASSYNKCTKCEDNNYLDANNNCQTNPYPIIPYCKTYNNYETCSNCEDGYHLKDGVCDINTTIKDCAIYDTSSSITSCLECESDSYLDKNTCVPRDKSLKIDNCEQTNLKIDQCKTCVYGFSLTSNNLLCLKSVSNCLQYDPNSGSTSSPLVCSQCDLGYYLDNTSKTCQEGTVKNCYQYEKNSNNCITCQNTYYLSDSQCVSHAKATACYIYSETQADTCTECYSNHLLVKAVKVCRPINKIDNCEVFSAFDTCSKCKDGYSLSQNKCNTIDPIENCLQKGANNTCIKCQPLYLLINGTCKMAQEFQTDFCIQHDDSGVNSSFQCELCDYNYYPFDFTYLNTCTSVKNLTNGGIKNCVKHLVDASGNYSCVMCDTDYLVSADQKSCVSDCGSSNTLLITSFSPQDTQSNGYMTVNNMSSNICVVSSGNLANCAIATTYDKSAIGCLKCKSNAVTSYSFDQDGSFSLFDAKDWTHSQTPDSFGYSSLFVTCLSASSATYYPGNTKPNSNCDYFKQTGNNFLCQKCIFGKTGPMVNVSLNGATYTYIDCNYDVTNCDISNVAKYGGFHLNTQSINNFKINPLFDFTCYKCNSITQIPVIHTRSKKVDSTKERLAPYGIEPSSSAPISASDLTGYHTVCRSITADDLAIPQNKFTATWIDNCGLAWYNTEITKDFEVPHSDSASIQCIECKPGYRKVINNDGFVISCDPISNCDTFATEGWFNSCSACSVGYSWRFDPVSKATNFDYCTSNNTDSNCMVVSQTNIRSLSYLSNHPSAYCRHCNKGYSFNKDGMCEHINPPRCMTNSFVDLRNIVFDLVVNKVNYNYIAEYLVPRGLGCTKCVDNFYGILLSDQTNNLACTYSSYLALNKLNVSSNYVAFCRYYSAEGNNQSCAQCEAGYVISTDNKVCVLETGYPRCSIVDLNHNVCAVCNDNYVLVDSVCQLKSIDKCMTYNINNPHVIECTQCMDTYTLTSPYKCEVGTISGCAAYNTDGSCASCLPYYAAITTDNVLEACIPLKGDLYCKYADNNLLTSSNTYSCVMCNDGYSFDATIKSNEKTLCLPSITIDNCYTYPDMDSLSNAIFECASCLGGYYPLNGKCAPQPTINKCKYYDTEQIGCSTCMSNYFLTADNLQCLANPSGVVDCIEYSSSTQCTKCKPYFSLEDNTCVSLPNAAYQNSCEYYKNTVECIGCKSPYMLTDSTTGCQTMTAKNCLTADSPTVCTSCALGYVLVTNATTNVTDCTAFKKKNCSNVDQKTYKCLQCVPGFYISNGDCVSVDKVITSCNIYSTSKACSECAYGYLLSADGLSCTATTSLKYDVFDGCDSIQYGAQLACNACDIGYYFNDGTCIRCPSSLMDNGCQACDYNAPNTCLLCQSNYYQTYDGTCRKVEQVPVDSAAQLIRNSVLTLMVMILAVLIK